MPNANGEGVATPQDPKAGEGTQPQDPQAQTASAQTPTGEGTQPQDPKGASNGEQTVNYHKYERDIANRDKTIAELKAQLEQSGKSASDVDKLQSELAELKDSLATEKANAALSAAGCVDTELGRVALKAFDGDIEKLKAEKPYLFNQPKSVSTGGSSAGTPSSAAKLEKAAYEAAGLTPPKH
ncbi:MULTISPECIES: hypothetical protein [Atopobium]|uniref:Scaffolding protein n=1 Tax=Atopobium minutum 10063974 TaxID=997872 RepID=N2C0E9_9ACTN|nr:MULTISPECIES: hypothetical protein [Atopobium]EMZ42644.1 hypothetical protein HMPREF1091_00202 [Atopobium minutum 10063974]ERL15292.1 hypothetical protein HMPREF1247_0843 [Atopobium sp. BV3Ac4]MDU5356477.1 hypothetical protein [Atopobium minutum]MDU5892721.1 hypothetical protein [Atopobium minutum]